MDRRQRRHSAGAAPTAGRKRSYVVRLLLAAAGVAIAVAVIYSFKGTGKTGLAQPLNKADFRERIAYGISLVDFWADWCPPCHIQAPIVEALAERFAGRALVAKMDIDKNREIAQELRISAIPTVIVFEDGREVRRFVGVNKEITLAQALTERLP